MAPIVSEEYPLLHIERIAQFVPLPPAALASPLPAICAEIFSPLLLTYYAPVKGIVLAYEDVRLSDEPPKNVASQAKKKKFRRRSRKEDDADENEEVQEQSSNDGGVVLVRQIDEYAAPFLWATASLLVWRPQTHTSILATLTHHSSTHITLSHLNMFPISVLKDQLPEDWTWHQDQAGNKSKKWSGEVVDEGGWWVDGDGEKVEEGKEIGVWIREWEAKVGRGGKGFLGIVGSLVGPVAEREQEQRGERSANGGRNSEIVEVD